MAQPQVIVIGNEKGGAGKSTLAIHIVTGLLHAGRKVAIIDLDLRQRSMERFFANRVAWTKANGHDLPQPIVPDMGDGKALHKADEAEQLARFEAAFAEAKGVADVIVIDTPGGDTALSRAAHGRADQPVGRPVAPQFLLSAGNGRRSLSRLSRRAPAARRPGHRRPRRSEPHRAAL